jgi:serine phosphatase RsbU (regulator of sigma subunit)
MVSKDATDQLAIELENFQDIASYIKPKPGDVPSLPGFDIYGETLPLNGMVGGDHIIYVDFKKRYDLDTRIRQAMERGQADVVEHLIKCQRTAGIAVIDVSGHRITDALLAAMLHQAFLLGSIYELDVFGHITKRLFENLNMRFYNSSGIHKFITMIYGEMTEDARFTFISAAHPAPIVFSRSNDRFMEVDKKLCTTCPPLGTMPSKNVVDRITPDSILGFKDEYELNRWQLMGEGDILLLCTDGLLDHGSVDEPYFPFRLETKVREVKDRSARQILEAIMEDVRRFSAPKDDISLVVIKRR